jgi:hypothetical protein
MNLINGLKARKRMCRSDWKYAPGAYIELLKWGDVEMIYITGQSLHMPTLMTEYGLSYADVISTCWIEKT